jgi:hypothetical protein
LSPASDRLVPEGDLLWGVGHNYAALEEQLFNVAQAQLREKVPAHGTPDDCGWKPVTLTERFRFLHLAIFLGQPNNMTMLAWVIADERACSPEDVGGASGYREMLNALARDPDSEEA